MMHETKALAVKQLEEDGSGLAILATLDAIDHDGDTYDPGAFGEQTAKVLDGHIWGGPPLGKARVYEQGNQALAEFQLNLGTQAGADWHKSLRFDLEQGTPLQEWSFGFRVLDAETETRDGDRVRVLKKLQVYEISPVVLGAGIGTRTVAIKGRSGLILGMAQVAGDLDVVLTEAEKVYSERAGEGVPYRKAWLDQLTALRDRLDEFLTKANPPRLVDIDDAEARQLFADLTHHEARLLGG